MSEDARKFSDYNDFRDYDGLAASMRRIGAELRYPGLAIEFRPRMVAHRSEVVLGESIGPEIPIPRVLNTIIQVATTVKTAAAICYKT